MDTSTIVWDILKGLGGIAITVVGFVIAGYLRNLHKKLEDMLNKLSELVTKIAVTERVLDMVQDKMDQIEQDCKQCRKEMNDRLHEIETKD